MFYDYKGKKYLLNLIDTPVCTYTRMNPICLFSRSKITGSLLQKKQEETLTTFFTDHYLHTGE